MELAGKEDRVINFLVDTIIIVFISVIISALVIILFKSVSVSDRSILFLIYLLVYFTYYITFELKMGQTPGKIISYTLVVKKNNRKLNFLDVFLRTLIRLTGLDLYSYLFGTELGMHDTLTNTKVIKDLGKESPAYNKS